MYSSKALTFFLAGVFVLSLCIGASATTYTWIGNDWSQPFRLTGLWHDSLGQTPASDTVLNTLMSDSSQGGEFQIVNVRNANTEIGIRGRDATDGELTSTTMALTIDAPFYYACDPNNGSRYGMCFKDQTKTGNNTWTFNELYFRGSMGFIDTGGPVHLAGNIQVTGPSEFITSSQGGRLASVDAFIDASRVNTFDVRWYSSKPSYTSAGNLHITNGNNAFFGLWRLTAKLFADTDGTLGDADVFVAGGGMIGTDPNATAEDGKNQGILVLASNHAISPSAQLELGEATYGGLSGKVIVNTGITANVRKLIVDANGVSYIIPAGTYTSATFPVTGRMEGDGSIVVADVNATAVMTMACATTLGAAITDANATLLPRLGTKAYMPGYTARIRAVTPMILTSGGYTFDHWTGTGITNTALADTTVLMDASKTVTAVYKKATGATTPSPLNRAGAVSVMTNISWTPDPAAASQDIYFGDSSTVYGSAATPIYTVAGSVNTITNAQLVAKVGALRDNANYYWQVRSGFAGDAKPQWVFTTGNIRVANPSPADAATETASDVTLTWTSPDAGATSFDVYFGTSKSDVENGLVTPTNVTTATLAESGLGRGQWYYWRVDSKFPSGKVGVGNVWSFRVNAVKIYLNTSDLTALDEASAPLSGVTAALDDGGVAIFKFDSFNFSQQYDFIVSGTNKLAIWSDNSITLGGVVSVSGPSNNTSSAGAAIAGGFLGGPSVIQQTDATQANYIATPIPFNGTPRSCNYHWFQKSDMNFYRDQHPGDANYKPIPDANSAALYGPGRPYAQYNYVATTDGQYPKWAKDSRSGTGGTYGGHGGNSTKTVIGAPGGHAATYAQNWTRYTASTQNLPGYYGQKELYELWGGSGGDGGFVSLGTTLNTTAHGGAAGGGVVEFYTKGNLTIGPNAKILSIGGNTTNFGTSTSQRAGGAGSGGSIRLVAMGNVTLSGKIAADGGKGADNPVATNTSNLTGPGGGGGRVAIYKGGTLNAAGGVVSVAGGSSGTYNSMTADLLAWQSGTSGTVYGMQAGEGAASMITNAHYPIPADGTRGIAAGTVSLTWIPGIGSTTNVVYFGTSSTPPLFTSTSGGRARKTATAPVNLNTKYYWRVQCDGVMGPLWMFRTAGYEAKNPSPAQSAVDVTTSALNLTWQDGYPDPNTITKREVFFGTDQAAVANATTTSPLKIATVTDKNALTVSRPSLLANTTYYWRVDTYASTVTPNYVDGLVWSFTTRQPICLGVLAGDFNNDCKVNLVDFAYLATDWMKCYSPAGCP
jgi:hypothetical protein